MINVISVVRNMLVDVTPEWQGTKMSIVRWMLPGQGGVGFLLVGITGVSVRTAGRLTPYDASKILLASRIVYL